MVWGCVKTELLSLGSGNDHRIEINNMYSIMQINNVGSHIIFLFNILLDIIVTVILATTIHTI